MREKFVPEWNYKRLITNMKRWSFESKMERAYEASKKLLPADAHIPDNLRMMALPEEIETFTMLAIKNGEWRSEEMTVHDFERAITAIRSYHHPKLFNQEGEKFAKWFMMITAANQFDYQANPIYRLNRYISYFTYVDEHINMESIMYDTFSMTYNEIAAPIIALWLSLVFKENAFDPKRLTWLFHRYRCSFDLLTLTREEYIQELDERTKDINDYLYCLRPSYSYPFVIDEDERFLPTPHLLLRSVTVSLMHRLTLGKNEIREQIGKYVLEPYLYKLILRSDEFQEVLPEQEYSDGQLTLDVMASIDNTIICFDSKSCTPLVDIRIFDYDAYEKTKAKIVKGVVQAYKHIRYKFGGVYSYLSVPVKEDRSNIFAIVVLAENPFCSLDDIYLDAATQLKIDLQSTEYNWLRGHVGIADLDAIEVQVLQRDNILDAITTNMRTGKYSDHWLLQGDQTRNKTITKYMQDQILKFITPVIDAMKADGL